MLIGFARHFGMGGSGPALDYLTGYLVNGEERAAKPEVIRGDPEAVGGIIDTLPFHRKYSSGVLSFAPEDHVTPEAEEEIMDRFENAVFAGLPPDRRSIVWIKHTDKGRTEMHFVVPRVDLGTGKSLNIAPPTPASRDLIDTLRTSINLRYGFRDPSDPAHAKSVSIPAHVAKLATQAERHGRSAKADIRQVITDRVLEQAQAGRIAGRTDVVSFLAKQGFTIARSGINYLTVVCPESGERVRLKGNIFREHFRPHDLAPAPTRRDPAQLLAVDRRLERLVEKRAAYHRERYAIGEPVEALHIREEPAHDRTGNTFTSTRPAPGEILPGARPAVRGDPYGLDAAAQRFGDATHSLERAGQRFDGAHSAFTRDFDTAVAEVERDGRTQDLVRSYSLGPPSPIPRRDLELERELER